MAEKVWNNPIDEHVDWGGDDSTGGLPVSGKQVQDFIKRSLKSKAGIFEYNTATNRYNVFSDEETKNKYLEDPTQTQLVLASFDAPFNYTAEVALTTPVYNAVFAGSTGNYIDFTFDIKNKQGQSTYESVICTYTIRRGSTSQVVTEQYAAGRLVHFNIDKYLAEGTNNITIGIQGTNTLAATIVSVTFQVVNLELSTTYDISQVYDLSTSSQIMTIPFSVGGYGTKVVEWYLDGEKLEFVKDVDEVVDISVSRTKYITLSNLSQGTHNIQIRTYTVIGGEQFYSDTLYREFMVYTGISDEVLFAIAMTVPSHLGIIENRKLYGITQYVPYTLNFATYSPNSTSLNVDIELNGEALGTVLSSNNYVNEFTLAPSTTGPSTLDLFTDNASCSIETDIAATSMSIAEITDALQLDFKALGRNNNASDKDVWMYNNYQGTFTGFNWNPSSGWVDNELYINSGASFGINLAPLAQSPTKLGKTIELEFSTTNVNDDNTVICDLRGDNGAGLVITATKVSLISEGGVVIETPFKDNETIRVAFVINKYADTTNKCMSFIYINGKIARGASWASVDNYISNKEILFVGSVGAEIKLSALRIYDSALTSDQILNNYILYRKNVVDMYNIYERNDVYTDGTSSFDPEKMAGRLPVMIITGEIPVLESTTDKNKQIVVDIEYTNLQDPTRNFVWKSAALRPQGTSSMGYPKKNFRPYSNKIDSTICYDSQGKVVKDRLYAFKDKSQRVDCWCLKADYAESSGAHNTGIARLWNDILVNSTLDGEYVFRTEAQKTAIANELGYDVRTTIDGFPILVFYRLTKDDPLVFIGKYNFNNDKSTPSVFGFEGIEGFDNSKMQCWEILNNGNALALFNTVDGFDAGWSEAFESRYPDTKTPDTKYLKAFCTWMSSVTKERFATEKWNHLDVYKVAAYYVYLLRFGAVDQTTKNAMLTSEDGEKFYYINYDNDTINGLTNEGKLVVPWNADRTTVGADGQPYYAGPNNRLWNMLEDDEEFMSIVRRVDEALYIGGLRYDNVIKMFDEEQTGKWVERVYNQDSQYKYIGPFVERGVNNLFMLQGDRSTHRKYWLARRFSLYDSKFISGDYKSQAIEIKCINNTPSGQEIGITAGTNMDYGYGINNIAREGNVTLNEGESYTFVTQETVNLGDPIRIYGASNIKGLDLSKMSDRLAVITMDKAYSSSLGTKLTHLIIGGDNVNTSVESISGLAQCVRLEHLDVRNMQGLKNIDLRNHINLKYLNATGTNINFIQLAPGCAIESLAVPASMKSLDLKDLPKLKPEELHLEDISGIHTINVKNCPEISKSFSLVENWINKKTTDSDKCSFTMDNINWENVSPESILKLAEIENLKLQGHAMLTHIDESLVNSLSTAFGKDIFDKNSEFYLDAPPSIFINGRTSILEGESETYSAIVFGDNVTNVTWAIISGISNATLDSSTAVLTTKEGYTGTIQIRARVFGDKGVTDKIIEIIVNQRIYPSSSDKISGPSNVESELTSYMLIGTNGTITGNITSEWTLSGGEGYLEIKSSTSTSCVIRKIQNVMTPITATLTLVITRMSNNAKWTFTKEIVSINENIAESDPGICQALYDAGLCVNNTYITKIEAQSITADDLYNGTSSSSSSIFYAQRSNIKNFEGFKYFTRVTRIPAYLFASCTQLRRVWFPNTITSTESNIFYNTQNMEIVIPESMIITGNLNVPSTSTVYIEKSLEEWMNSENSCIYEGSSANINVLLQGQLINELVIPSHIRNIRPYCFSGWSNIKSVTISEGVETVGACAFNSCKLSNIFIPSTLTKWENGVSDQNQWTTDLKFLGNHTYDDGSLLILNNVLSCVTPSARNSINIPNNVVKLADNVFRSCRYSSLTIPNSVTEIGNGAFYSCRNLTNITIPNSVTWIGNDAFRDCSNLTSVTIGNGVTSIGINTFYNCTKITSVNVVDLTSWCRIDFGGSSSNPFYSGKAKLYLNGIELTDITIPDSVTSIGSYAFYNYTLLKSVTIPAGVTSIGMSAFGKCGGELTVNCNIPSSSGQTSSGPFYATLFTSVTIGDGVTSIGDHAFVSSTSLTSITIPNSVTSIGRSAFNGCTALESDIVIPEGVTSLGEYTFDACGKIPTITFPTTLKRIGAYSFRSCHMLHTIWCYSDHISTDSQVFSNAGKNVDSSVSKVLYVPSTAEYNTYQWKYLQDSCGFTLSKTL